MTATKEPTALHKGTVITVYSTRHGHYASWRDIGGKSHIRGPRSSRGEAIDVARAAIDGKAVKP